MDFNQMPRFKKFQFQIVCAVPEWARAYEVPVTEVERQIPIAHAWCANNPRRAPKKDILRFLNNWMSIAKRHGSMMTERRIKARAPDVESEMSFDEMVAIRKRNMGQ